MTKTIKLPYTKKADHSIIRALIKAGVGVVITTGLMKLMDYFKINNVLSTSIGGLCGTFAGVLINLPHGGEFDCGKKTIIMTNKGPVVIESSFEESFPYSVLPFWAGLITSTVPILRLEHKVNSNTDFIIEESLLKFVLPVISAAACESYNYCEKIYQYRCIDIHKRVMTNHSSIHLVGDQVITSNYTSAKFATDYSKELVYLGDDQFQILHNGEPVYITNSVDDILEAILDSREMSSIL